MMGGGPFGMVAGARWLRGLAAGLILSLVVAPLGAGETLRGMPEVIDGDTLVLHGQRLRLQGIDAPELGQLCLIKSRLYDCGMVARTALLDLSAGAEVVCRPLASGPGDLTMAHCAADDYDLSEGMTYTGWALADPTQPSPYRRLEAGARAAQRGLWRGRFVTPWAWRDGERLPEESQGG